MSRETYFLISKIGQRCHLNDVAFYMDTYSYRFTVHQGYRYTISSVFLSS